MRGAGRSGAHSGAEPEGLKPRALVFAVVVGTLLWALPQPEGLSAEAWRLLAIFVATILAIVTRAMPMGATAMVGLAVTVLTGTVEIRDGLSGFAHPVTWLVLAAFFIARGFIKTGLGTRVAYFFIRVLGRTSLGLGYGLVVSDLFLAPAIPSTTARSGGVIVPILRSLAKSLGSEPDDGTARQIGEFLTLTAFQATVVTSAMFLTAMAANPLIVALAGEEGIGLTWGRWAAAAAVPGAVSLVVLPLLIYALYPPLIRETPEAAELARERLDAMGPMSGKEWTMFAVFVLLLLLWSVGSAMGLHVTATALGGVAILLVFRVLEWEDVVGEREAWNTMVWFAVLVMMATLLGRLGVFSWLTQGVSEAFDGTNWVLAFVGLTLIYVYSHYFFASITAHVSVMYAPFLAVALGVGTPPLLAALVLAYFSSLMSSTTHYGGGMSPILFGTGYVEIGTWWKLGALISVVNLVVWMGVGGMWWKLLGLW